MENINNTEEYLTLIDIIKILKKKIVFILLVTILCTGIIALKVMFLSTPMYVASATAIVVKRDTSIVQNSKNESQYTQNDILLYEKIIDTYVQIAQSNLVMDKTAEELKNYSSSQVRAMVTAAPITLANSSSTSSLSGGAGNTQIIKLTAVGSNRDDVAKISNTYCKNFIEESMSLLPVGKIQVLDEARTPSNPIPTSKSRSIACGFLFGLLLSIGIVLFRNYIDRLKIGNEKQVKDILNIPVIVTIE
ncbi:hypothetical protein I6U48_01140 [Clostridium sp. PL3]|uniref:Capsular biosynthesis protein n=1 Tax=Clostridium thailandense TaxID=2794346 RepID=A0A949TSJ8_9CLOT|nr:Wzz/FepE/Etk N-terminal domain-containing protein [Clostridium thailandense]MBV7271523.1 hypothetical protein [Clostridium thailandense]